MTNRLDDRVAAYRRRGNQFRMPSKAMAVGCAAAATAMTAGGADAAISHFDTPITVVRTATNSVASTIVDLDGDMNIDIALRVGSYTTTTTTPGPTTGTTSSFRSVRAVGIIGSAHVAFVGMPSFSSLSQLSKGQQVGPGGTGFILLAGLMQFYRYYTDINTATTSVPNVTGPSSGGQFTPSNTGYAGFFIANADGTRFGWLKLHFTEDAFGPDSVTLLAWAIENEPNTAITVGAVPEPSTLGLLALGAAGVLAGRRRRRAAD